LLPPLFFFLKNNCLQNSAIEGFLENRGFDFFIKKLFFNHNTYKHPEYFDKLIYDFKQPKKQVKNPK